MLFNDDANIPLVFVSDLGDSDATEETINLDWESGVAALFQSPMVVKEKKEAPAFLPVRFKPKSEWVENHRGNTRIDENVDVVTMAVLDIDTKEAYDRAKTILSGIEYYCTRTFSGLKDGIDKFRIVMPMEEFVPGEEWKTFISKIIDPIGADEMCSNPSRMYFVPVCPEDPAVNYEFIHNKGEKLSQKFADAIVDQHRKDLRVQGKKDELLKFERRIGGDQGYKEMIHFSGKRITSKRFPSPIIDCSFEGYLGRHRHLVDQHLRGHENHRFVRQLTINELALNREYTDVPSLVRFICRAYEEFPNKHGGLIGRPGNTIEEIPRLIRGAAEMAIESRTARRDLLGQFDWNSIERSIASAKVERSDAIARYGSQAKPEQMFQFPGIIDRRIPSKNPDRQTINGKIARRNKEAIEEYKETGVWIDFVRSVFENEDAINDPKRLHDTTLFIAKATDQINRDVFKKKINAGLFRKALSRASASIAGQNEPLSRKIKVGFLEGMQSMKNLEAEQKQALEP